MQLSIVIPVFNEKDNIGLLVRDIYEKLNKTEFELTIVDDSSNDGTIEVLKNIERKYKDIKIKKRKVIKIKLLLVKKYKNYVKNTKLNI